MYFFGTGGDGNNGNRVAGGAAPIVLGSPAYSSNYVTCGYNGSASNCLDLNLQRSAAVLAAGWTWAAVWRGNAAAGATAGNIIADNGGGGGTAPAGATICGFSYQSPTSFNTYIHSSGNAIRATFVLPVHNGGSWHFSAETYTGGAAGTWSLNEFSDAPAGGTPVTYVASGLASGTNSPTIGTLVPPWTNTYTYLVDCAWAMVSQGPMLQADLATLAAAVRPWLARRGIVM